MLLWQIFKCKQQLQLSRHEQTNEGGKTKFQCTECAIIRKMVVGQKHAKMLLVTMSGQYFMASRESALANLPARFFGLSLSTHAPEAGETKF